MTDQGLGSAKFALGHPFCSSCGLSKTDRDGKCECGSENSPSEQTKSTVGDVRLLRRGLRRQKVLVVDDAGPTVECLTPKGETLSVERRRIEASPVVDSLAAIPSPAFRLQVRSGEPAWDQALKRQLPLLLPRLLESVEEQRLFARSAIAAGMEPSADGHLHLSETEMSWLRMHAERFQGNPIRAARWALELAPDRYPDHLYVIAEAIASGCPPDLEEELLGHLSQTPQDHPAVLLCASLKGNGPDLADLQELARQLPLQDDANDLIEDWTRAEQEAGPSDNVFDRAYVALVRDKPYQWSTGDQRALIPHRAVLDELLERFPQFFELDTDTPAEVRARLDPAGLTESQLREVGHWDELARRYLVSGESERLRDLPSTAMVDFYRSLALARTGDLSEVDQLATDRVAAAVVKTLKTGQLAPEALEDRTTWSVLDSYISDAQLAELGPEGLRALLGRCLNAILSWRWQDAADTCRSILRRECDERLRDEALNLLGFALFQMHRDQDAIRALEKALDGLHSANLQVNAGVVAAHLEPNEAAEFLAALAAEAPSLELRLAAARRAYGLWTPTNPAWEENDEDGELPESLRKVFRTLAVANTAIEDHRWILAMLAGYDSDWLANKSNTESSPHSGTPEHGFYVARAAGDPEGLISNLKKALDGDPAATWAEAERDRFVEGLTSLIFENQGEIGPAVWAFEAIDQGLPMQPTAQVLLTSVSVMAICRQLANENALPSDRILELLRKADKSAALLDRDEDDDLVGTLLAAAFDAYAIAVGSAYAKQVDEAQEAMNAIRLQLVGIPRRRINWGAVRKAVNPIISFLLEAFVAVESVERLARSDEVRGMLHELRQGMQEFRLYAEGFLR